MVTSENKSKPKYGKSYHKSIIIDQYSATEYRIWKDYKLTSSQWAYSTAAEVM
jgi:hypothetical protein